MATEIKVSSRTGGMVGGIFIGVALIWLGISLYLRKAEIITHWWPYFILGLGALFILVGIAMLFLSWLRKGAIGMFITGLILGAIGIIPILGGGWGQWWFLIIVLGGVIIVVSVIWSAVTAKKKK
ncbi:hypothetical protein KAX06_03330 [candidate division WOR-3 bacterium]|nr:hypothetical protein [candidate division WOR-3 bacterium]